MLLTNASFALRSRTTSPNFTHASACLNDTWPVEPWKEEMALPILMFAGGAIGNIIAVVVLSMSRQDRKSSAFYALVCGLAVTDLLGTCLASPLTIANYLDPRVLRGGALCDFHAFLLLFFGLTGLGIICAMAAERYLAICCPYWYRRWGVDRRFARTFLTCVYAANVLFCCLPVTGAVRGSLQASETWCFVDLRTPEPVAAVYSVLYGAVSVLLIAGTTALNVAVCGSLLLMRRRSVRRGTEGGRSSVRARWRALSSAAEIQIVAVLVVTSLVVLACSAPLVVRVFANRLMLKDDPEADLAAIRIAAVNPILDPWIYILLRRSLFRRILSLSRRCRTRSSSALTTQGRLFYPEHIKDSNVLSQMMHTCLRTSLPAASTVSLPHVHSVDLKFRD
ncbi:prostaglandin E2 receptor EP4 subtype-like [Phyllopteryx taeniolatus]|uniref:prostaglandin E2 receptor EP4 subtype-like n=1 Tax=Phyllopteryx taeniolatus TaxID=161469 RepID=UPI002AD43817|nr:prostaglandin E2 receptor EP4 subtype-like [Phyllopteryx taeniolatus]